MSRVPSRLAAARKITGISDLGDRFFPLFYVDDDTGSRCNCDGEHAGAECEFECPSWLGHACNRRGQCVVLHANDGMALRASCVCDAHSHGEKCELTCPTGVGDGGSNSVGECAGKGECVVSEDDCEGGTYTSGYCGAWALGITCGCCITCGCSTCGCCITCGCAWTEKESVFAFCKTIGCTGAIVVGPSSLAAVGSRCRPGRGTSA